VGSGWVKKCIEYEAEGARPGSGLGRTRREVVGKTAGHVNWMGRMPWIVMDGGSRWEIIDDHDGFGWVNVSSGTGSPGLSRTKFREP